LSSVHIMWPCSFTLMWHENLHYFRNVRDNVWFSAIGHTQSVVALIWFWRPVTSLSWHQSCVGIDYVSDVITGLILAFLTNMGEKHKCTSPRAIQVKNQWKTISNEEKLEVISQKMNRLLTYAVMLDLLMVAYE
jgi:hypothetical protein